MQGPSRSAPDPSMVPLPERFLQVHLSRSPSHGASKEFGAHITSVMIRNVPCGINLDSAMQILESLGFSGTYDFLYLPMNSKKNANLGYFFVNFIKPEDAQRCSEHLTGESFGCGLSAKRCEVSAAHIQGYSSMSSFFKRKAVLRSKGPPLFIAKGVPLTPDSLKIQALVKGGGFVYSL